MRPGVDVELLVVGAGPAGIGAALEARRLGLSARVLDKATFPRDKTCGDGLTTGALRLLDGLGLDVRGLPSFAPVTETVVVTPQGRQLVLPLPRDGEYACVVPRVELDAALVGHARTRGVDMQEGAEVVTARSEGDRVAVTLGDGTELLASWVVAADGHYSPLRRLLGSPDDTLDGRADLGTWHAFRQYFSGVDDRRLWVIFDADLLPGYAWVFPLAGGRANVGFGLLRGGRTPTDGKTLAHVWRGLAERPSMRRALGANAVPEGTRRAWPIPASYRRERLTSGRVLFAGDAAGVVDPMTGEGIAQALETGVLAARAVAEGRADPGSVPLRYRDAVDDALGADLRFAGALQRILRSPFGAGAAMGAAGLTPWTRRNFARWMFEDYPRALVFTPRRWHRGMFTAPGAYRDAATTSSS